MVQKFCTTWDGAETLNKNGINYQPQRVFSPDFWLPSIKMVQTIASPDGWKRQLFRVAIFVENSREFFFELLLFFAHSSVDAILGESFRPWKNQPLEVRRFRNWKSIIFGGSMLNFVLGGVRFLSSTLGCPRKLGSMVSKWVVTYL